MKAVINRLLSFFFQGLVLTAPLAVTVYVIYALFVKLDSILQLELPGLGILIIIAGITFLGFISSSFIIKPVFLIFEKLLNSLPLVKIIYSSLKDLISAFVGDKKKFDQAVLVVVNNQTNLQKIGFITQSDLHTLGLEDKIAVYFPHSYNFSGDLFIVSKEFVTPLQLPSSQVMKFVVSGGVSGFEHLESSPKD